jgi:hypothetical protein
MTPDEREAILDRPAIPPPPGITSHLANPETVRSWNLPLQIAVFTIITLLVAAWIFTKMKIVKRTFVDDYIVFLAYVSD